MDTVDKNATFFILLFFNVFLILLIMTHTYVFANTNNTIYFLKVLFSPFIEPC